MQLGMLRQEAKVDDIWEGEGSPSHWKAHADLLWCVRGCSSFSTWPLNTRRCRFAGVPLSSSSFAFMSRMSACSQHACNLRACHCHKYLQHMLGTCRCLAGHRVYILFRVASNSWLHDGHQMPVNQWHIIWSAEKSTSACLLGQQRGDVWSHANASNTSSK